SSAPLLPELLEGAALGRRHVAAACPAAGERQRAETAAAAPGDAERAGRRGGGEAIELRALREKRPELQPRTIGGRLQPALELPLAPVPHHLRQRDLHRADALAFAAEGGG